MKIFKVHFDAGAAVHLEGEETGSVHAGFGFAVVDGLLAVELQSDVVTVGGDDVFVPGLGVEIGNRRLGQHLLATGFVIKSAPIFFADVGLVAGHFVGIGDGFGPELDTAVADSADELELESKPEIAVVLLRAEKIVVLQTAVFAGDNAIVDGPQTGGIDDEVFKLQFGGQGEGGEKERRDEQAGHTRHHTHMDFAAQLKSAVDIVKVIGAYVPLKKRGTSSYIGLCPFHSEKSPSFNVHPTQQFYKCFGCGAGGDVIKFVMEYEKVTFQEAISSLAEQFGVPMPEKKSAMNDPEARMRTAVLAMHEIAAKVFQQNLAGPAGADARAYLERRKLPLSRAAEFGVGFSEKSGQHLIRVLKSQGFSPGELEESGLVGKRDDGTFYDKFRGRLMFPICNEGGKVIAFGGRALYEGDEPKYLNSPGTPIYTKSLVLYHLHRAREAARKTGRLVLVEGYMDVIGAWAAGVKEAVAPCGTALTPQQVKMMSKYAPLVVVNFDPDNAGANAAEKSIAILLEEHMRIRIATLEGGLDPDEYVAAHGAEAYVSRIDKAQNYFHWLAGRAQQRFDTKSAEGKVQALEFLLPAIRRVQDPMERASLAAELANRLGVDQAMLLDQFRRMAVQRTERRMSAPVLELSPAEKVLLQLLLQSPAICAFAAAVLLDDERLEHFALTSSPAWPMWQKVLRQAAEGPLEFSRLEEHLSASEKTLMAGLVFADRTADEQEEMMQAAACLAQFAAVGRRARINDLKRHIRSLEQSGSMAEALAMTEEIYALERQEKA